MNKWKWGNLHQVEFEHPLGKAKPLNLIFNIGPFPAGGGFFQIDNMTSARYKDDFAVKLGPSTRRLIDMANPRESLGILPTGNSGNLFSRHYSDQVQMFLNGAYRGQLTSKTDYDGESSNLLILKE
ncbi:penicillin acylase family protein [Bacteriovoracaceae bacterium]|nr:penicillin acylase family protein [Bacteriovoracaceae bacterium]